ncbi:MAG: hypothetical protein RLY57_458, partial [Candidatus Parcubacteria bacterium]
VISNISRLRKNTEKVFQISLLNSIFYPTLATRISEISLKINRNAFDELKEIPIKWEVYAENMTKKEGVIVLNFRDDIS